MKPIASFEAGGTCMPALDSTYRIGGLAVVSSVFASGTAMKAKTIDEMKDVRN